MSSDLGFKSEAAARPPSARSLYTGVPKRTRTKKTAQKSARPTDKANNDGAYPEAPNVSIPGISIFAGKLIAEAKRREKEKKHTIQQEPEQYKKQILNSLKKNASSREEIVTHTRATATKADAHYSSNVHELQDQLDELRSGTVEQLALLIHRLRALEERVDRLDEQREDQDSESSDEEEYALK